MEEDLQCLISRLTRSNVSLLHENEHLQFEAQVNGLSVCLSITLLF